MLTQSSTSKVSIIDLVDMIFIISIAARTFATATNDVHDEPRFLDQVRMFFDRAASKTDIPAEYLALIKNCDCVIRFNIPLKRDNGSIETITCYRYLLSFELTCIF